MGILKQITTGVLVALASLSLVACGAKQDPNAGHKPTDVIDHRVSENPQLVTIPTARPESDTMNCVVAGRTADNRTEAQARDLDVGTEVTIDGEKKALPQGGSYYSLCKGATAEERLAATSINLTRTTAQFSQANTTLEQAQSWIYVDPTGPKVRENTWNYQAIQGKKSLDNAVTLNFLLGLFGVLVTIGMIVAMFRDHIEEVLRSMGRPNQHHRVPA